MVTLSYHHRLLQTVWYKQFTLLETGNSELGANEIVLLTHRGRRVVMGLLLAVCSRRGVVLVSLYKDRDHDFPKVHLYIISYRGVGLPSGRSEVTKPSTAPSLWEQRLPQEACPQNPHRHSLRTDYRLAFVSPWPSWNPTVEGSETEASEMKELKMSRRHRETRPSSSSYQLSAVSWSRKAEVPTSIEQNLMHPENFEILNFCPRGGEAIASRNAF